ncbi:MAG TPA: class I SAM-dependent methyltransferase [Actinomycetes bacterium]
MVGSADAARALELLEAAEGLELLAWLAARGPVAAGEELAVGERLRERFAAELVVAAMAQHELRGRARAKFAEPERLLFTRDGLEQSSSEPVARHRAARYAGLPLVADLCTGIGGDLIALADGRAALAVDRDPVHLRMALRNARAMGATEVAGACADVRHLRLDRLPPVFVDPARRAGGRRLPAGTSEPPLGWCLALAGHVTEVGIKAAPGIPLDLVPAGWEVELIADGHDLKEAVLWSPAMATTPRRATVLLGREAAHSLSMRPRPGPPGHEPCHSLVARPGPGLPVRQPGAFLLDPNPAVTRAGLVEELGRGLDAWKIDDRVGFLSADHPMATPFGRPLAVEASLPWNLKRLRATLRARRAGAVEIRKRGSAVDVEDLRRRLDLRGDRRLTVVLTRVLDRPWALVCRDPGEAG